MNFRQHLLIFLVIIFCIPVTNLSAAITRTLSIGSRGVDVKELQVILNKDTTTKITSAGPGSPGNETEYFGLLTAKAVVAFQEKYKKEILTPAGLTLGTGTVGSFTRAKLNSLFNTTQTVTTNNLVPNNIVPTNSTPPASVPAFTYTSISYPILYSVPATVKRGSTVVIYGANFSLTGNTIIFGTEKIGNISSPDQQKIQFTVPTTLQNGTYNVSVQNDIQLTSQKSSTVTVTDIQPITPLIFDANPKIVSVSPGSDLRVTVTGSGFSLTDNTIQSSFGSIANVKATSESELTFSLEDFAQFDQVRVNPYAKGASVPLIFGIANSGGSTPKTIQILVQF